MLIIALTIFMVEVASSIKLGNEGAYTTLPLWIYPAAPWAIAILTLVAVGMKPFFGKPYSKFLTSIALIILFIALVSTLEGELRLGRRLSENWINWTTENSWFRKSDSQFFNWQNFSLVGLFISLITISNTFTTIVYSNAVSWALPERYLVPSLPVTIESLLILIGLVSILSIALHIVVSTQRSFSSTIPLPQGASVPLDFLKNRWARWRTSPRWQQWKTQARNASRSKIWLITGRTFRILLVVLFVVDLIGVGLTWRVQKVEWTAIQPTGLPVGFPHSIQSIAVNNKNGVIWVGTYEGGVFRSYDHGESWEAANNGLKYQHIKSLIEGNEKDEMVLGSTGGVFVWNEKSDIWMDRSSGLTDHDVQVLLLTSKERTFFAGTARSGLFATDDMDSGWKRVETLAPLDIRTLAEDPMNGDLYLGTSSAGIYRSTDSGVTWSSVNEGLSDQFVRAIVVDEDSGKIYAGTNSSGVYIFDVKTERWNRASVGLSQLTVRSLSIIDDGVLLAAVFGGGVFISEDGGQSWHSGAQGIRDLKTRVLGFDPARNDVFVGTDEGGLYISRNGTSSWKSANIGLESVSVQDIEVISTNQVFAGTFGGGVFRSSDEGKWEVASSGLESAFINQLQHIPFLGLYAGSNFTGASVSGSFNNEWRETDDFDGLRNATFNPSNLILPKGKVLYTTHDRGTSWDSIYTGNFDYSTIVYVPNGGFYLAGTTTNGVYRSVDDGRHWEDSSVGLGLQGVRNFAIDTSNERIYAMNLYAGEGLYRSDDLGKSWQKMSLPLQLIPEPEVNPEGYELSKIEIAPDGVSLLLGTLGAGVWSSHDGGNSWQEANSGLMDRNVRDIAVDIEKKRIYVATDSAAILNSDDGGQTWWPAHTGVSDLFIRSMAAGPNPGQLFAGTYGAGVYRSKDYGLTWEEAPGGMADLNVTSLLWLSSKNLLFAATADQSLYRSHDFGDSWEEVLESTKATEDGNTLLLTDPDQEIITFLGDYGFWKSTDGGEHWSKSGLDYLFNRLSGPNVRVSYWNNNLSFYKAGVGWLHLASYSKQLPEAVTLEARRAILYASNGAPTLLRGEVQLPLIWAAPTPYLRMVSLSDWLLARVVERRGTIFLALGLTILLLSVVAYTGIVRPNNLHLRTVLWLLIHPRQLFDAANYSRYIQRIRENSALEQLLLLLAPPRAPFSLQSATSLLRDAGSLAEKELVQSAILNLERKGLIHVHNSDWTHAEPFLNEIYKMEVEPREKQTLIVADQETNPLFSMSLRWLNRADLKVVPITEGALYRAVPETDDLLRILPGGLFIKIIPGVVLDDQGVRDLHNQVRLCDPAMKVVLVILDRRPSDQGWAQIGTLRLAGFTVLPIESSLLSETLSLGKEHDALRNQLEGRLGANFNPFDVRDPVSGAFSFFGRDALVESILRRMISGRSIGIFGLRKMGKSSVLKALREQADFPIAFLNLQATGREEIREIFQRILRYWSDWVRVRYELTWTPPDLSGADPTGQYTLAVLALLESLSTRVGSPRLGILLDEIETIVPRADGSGANLTRYLAFMRTLRGQIDEGLPLSLVVSSLNPSVIRINAWHDEQNPVYNLLQEEYLGPLEIDHCIQMVTNLGQQIRMGFEEMVLNEIYSFSGGHPFLTRQLCSVLFSQISSFPTMISRDMLKEAVNQFIHDDSTVVHLDAGLFGEASNPNLWGPEHVELNKQILLELARAARPLRPEEFNAKLNPDLLLSALYNMRRYHLVYQPDKDHYALRFEALRIWLRRRKLGVE